jgi:hypothetical protein
VRETDRDRDRLTDRDRQRQTETDRDREIEESGNLKAIIIKLCLLLGSISPAAAKDGTESRPSSAMLASRANGSLSASRAPVGER